MPAGSAGPDASRIGQWQLCGLHGTILACLSLLAMCLMLKAGASLLHQRADALSVL